MKKLAIAELLNTVQEKDEVMGKLKKITVLGNFSGRNAGDAAILGNLLDDIAAAHPDALFIVPTLNPRFVKRHFGHHNLKALGLLPWNGALKIFG
ncbi:MAG: hypothetical protein F6K47_41680, partial [Symploca sp. SIO2E6]|nr:hypothetical protein [Symploca sp. SIO2E6]